MAIFLLCVIIALLIYQHGHLRQKINSVLNKVYELETKILELKKDGIKPESKLQSEEDTNSKLDTTQVPQTIFEEKTPEISKGFSSFQTINSYEVPSFVEEEEETEDLTPYEIELANEHNSENELPEEEIVEEQQGWYQNFTNRNPDIERFIGENLISKIGIAILVLGIAFFVQFAIDNNWINESARVGIGVLAGAIILGFAHRLKQEFKAFSSVLVSGGIAVFYFTMYIGFQEYHLFSQTIAFALMIVITAFSVLISLAYNRQELAVLSLIGGVATPFLLSTGSGNYQVLFTYLIILDLGILVLAYFRNWNLLNLLTYLFSTLIFGVWFRQKVLGIENDAPYLGALIFGTLFYIIFAISNLVNQIKEKRPFQAMELSLILSNTFIYFGIGLSCLNLFHPELKGIFTIFLALFNLVITYFINKNYKVDKNLFYLLIGLTLTFITLAAPIQLKGNYITLFWAAETGLLLWLAQKSKLQIYRFVSVLIMILALFSLVMDWFKLYESGDEMAIVLNPAFLSGLFVIACFSFYRHLLVKEGNNQFSFYYLDISSENLVGFTSIIILLLGYFVGILELNNQVRAFVEMNFQSNVILLTYHLIFSSILILVIKRYNYEKVNDLLLFLYYINLVAYIFIIGFFSDKEIYAQMQNSSSIPWAYWMHFVAIIPFIHQMINLYKLESAKNDKASSWLLMIFLTFLLSSEALWQRIQIAAFSWSNEELLSVLLDEEFEMIKNAFIKTGFPILWGVLAFYLLQMGIKRRRKPLRIAALTLLGITILKLFTYDISNVSKGGKIGAFILLGVVLLVVSFTYQKIKSIILDEDQANKEEQPTD